MSFDSVGPNSEKSKQSNANALVTTAQMVISNCFKHRDSIGGSAVIGDMRWTGTFGVNVDLVARTHCSAELIKTEHILVRDSTSTDFMIVRGWNILYIHYE